MERLILFDTEGEKGHNWFYNYSILLGLKNSRFNIKYITCISDQNKIKIIEENRIDFENTYVQEKEATTTERFKEKKILKAVKTNIKEKLIYKNSKIKLIYTELCDLKVVLTNKKKIEQVKKVIVNSEKGDMASVHFLTLDYIIYDLFFLCIKDKFFIHKKNETRITATLHWAPNTFLKCFIIKYLLKHGYITKLIVHGDYIRRSMINKLGIQCENFICNIPYPVSSSEVKSKDTCINKIGLKDRSGPFLLCFGGTRYEKGLDLMLEACKFIKSSFTLIIAGEEGEITKDFINNKIKELCLEEKIFLDLKYIGDELLPYYFSVSDIVVLPYRKTFTGQSGPLTEGINYNKIVIAPNINELGYIVSKYNIGKAFNCEDVEDLAMTIEYCVKNIAKLKGNFINGQEMFKEDTNISKFKSNYKDFFYSL
ncbi:glycosyltransferase [Clostridium estertheticum]|uniref:glycosyltransferase n=1 Tax=Clostridium estertheticum TaxID=238834 RepID=UPI001C0B62DA|nr:glycosyltransferase [Clostridium estertheticum]MBU3200973.1 glycosyltransferase [Clostridium estertheticum]WAG63395.1 glycosyltransferase [Clostridium estertheticum]